MAPETFRQKAARHIQERDFHMDTIRRGLVFAYHGALYRLHSLRKNASVAIESVEHDVNDNRDLTVTTIRRKDTEDGCLFYTSFPADSQLVVYTTKKGEPTVHTNLGQTLMPDVIASFTGPTFTYEDNLPNNGFFKREGSEDADRPCFTAELESSSFGDYRPFMDTNPPGQRRGAFGLTKAGEVVLLNDVEKFAAVESGFAGFKALVGTSFYMESHDQESGRDADMYRDEYYEFLSYLVHMDDGKGRTRLAHFLSPIMISRRMAKETLDIIMKVNGFTSYRAVELEYFHSNCLVGSRALSGYGGFSTRRDHYLICSKKEDTS